MFWRYICLAVCLALFAGNAHAQRVVRMAGPEGVPLSVRFSGDTPTLDSVTAQLSEALANFDNSGITIQEGAVGRGDVIATRASPYAGAVRVSNDVSRSGALGGRVVVLPAGTALYAHEFVNADVLIVSDTTRVRRLWCGVTGTQGYCIMQRRGSWEGAEIRSQSPYAPTELGPFVPVSAPDLADDPSAVAEFPERLEIYRFTGMRGSRAVIARSVRIGEETIEVGDMQTRRMRLGSLMVRIEGAGDSATVSAAALDPADYQGELRSLARAMISYSR